MMPIYPIPTQTSPRPVLPDGPLFRYIRTLKQVTEIYRWSHLRVVLYLLDSPSLPDDCFLGSQDVVAWYTDRSKATVFKVFRALQEDGLIVKLDNSVWQVSQPLLDLAKR